MNRYMCQKCKKSYDRKSRLDSHNCVGNGMASGVATNGMVEMATNGNGMATNGNDMADVATNGKDMATNGEDMATNGKDMATNGKDMADMATNGKDMADMATNGKDMASVANGRRKIKLNKEREIVESSVYNKGYWLPPIVLVASTVAVASYYYGRANEWWSKDKTPALDRASADQQATDKSAIPTKKKKEAAEDW